VGEIGKGESTLVVPQQSLQLDQSGTFVLVVDKDKKVQVRRVETGQAVGTNIAVTKGLAADDLVITEGIQKVRPGQVVQATETKLGI
jgi:membrane fusion protein (multidrug efflux system)